MKNYISLKDTAKIIRGKLKNNWPQVKFSVKGKSYSGGASINIHWTDGPTRLQVEKVVKNFQGATFDGMADLKTYIDQTDEHGNVVHYGADYIFCHREFSRELLERAVKEIANVFDVQALPVLDFDWGASIDINGTAYKDRILPSCMRRPGFGQFVGEPFERAAVAYAHSLSCVPKPRIKVHLERKTP